MRKKPQQCFDIEMHRPTANEWYFSIWNIAHAKVARLVEIIEYFISNLMSGKGHMPLC